MLLDDFDYDNKTEEELSDLLPDGDYKFEVSEYTHEISKSSGNPQIKLKLRVYDGKGGARIITDYLLKVLAYKIKHFCDSTGLEEEYSSKTFKPSLCAGRTGFVKIKKEIDPTGQYSPKNAVKDYIKQDKIKLVEAKQANEEFFNDEIPF